MGFVSRQAWIVGGAVAVVVAAVVTALIVNEAGGRPVLAAGRVVVHGDGSVHLCGGRDLRAVNQPPNCVGGLDVEGLDLTTVPMLASNAGHQWTPPMVLQGRRHDGILSGARVPPLFRLELTGLRSDEVNLRATRRPFRHAGRSWPTHRCRCNPQSRRASDPSQTADPRGLQRWIAPTDIAGMPDQCLLHRWLPRRRDRPHASRALPVPAQCGTRHNHRHPP